MCTFCGLKYHYVFETCNVMSYEGGGLVFPFTIYQSSVITIVTIESGITTLIGNANEQFDVLMSRAVFLHIAQFPESPETND